MRRVQRFQVAQYKCLVIKHAKDTRYSNMFSTHDRSVPAPPLPEKPRPQEADTAQKVLWEVFRGNG